MNKCCISLQHVNNVTLLTKLVKCNTRELVRDGSFLAVTHIQGKAVRKVQNLPVYLDTVTKLINSLTTIDSQQ